MCNKYLHNSQKKSKLPHHPSLYCLYKRDEKTIGQLFKDGKKDETVILKEESLKIKQETKLLSEKLNDVKTKIDNILYQIPNVPNKNVPTGNTQDDNVIIFESDLNINPNSNIPHWELAEKYDIIDFEMGNKITGSGFPVYKGQGAKLQRALISFFLDCNISFGYEEVQVPHLVNEQSAFGTGNLPDKEGQMYSIPEDNLFLIPTAEIPITNIFRNEIIDESKLPILKTGYTPCFRREAGSYGSHVRGLNRLHQFDKVEIVRVDHLGSIRSKYNIELNEKEGYIKVVANDENPFISSQLVEKITKNLQSKIIEIRTNKIKERLEFSKEQYELKQLEFDFLQKKLAEFKDSNKNISTARFMAELQKLESEYQLQQNILINLASEYNNNKIKLNKDTPIFLIERKWKKCLLLFEYAEKDSVCH